jgi:putative endonuclease
MREADPDRTPDPRRVARERGGRWAEHVVAVFLMLHGYRILARRHRTPFGELDLIAKRGNRLAFVEVKYRQTREAGEASLTEFQMRRMHNAAEHWVARHPRAISMEQGFDAVIVTPWARPILMRDACQPDGYTRS